MAYLYKRKHGEPKKERHSSDSGLRSSSFGKENRHKVPTSVVELVHIILGSVPELQDSFSPFFGGGGVCMSFSHVKTEPQQNVGAHLTRAKIEVYRFLAKMVSE